MNGNTMRGIDIAGGRVCEIDDGNMNWSHSEIFSDGYKKLPCRDLSAIIRLMHHLEECVP